MKAIQAKGLKINTFKPVAPLRYRSLSALAIILGTSSLYSTLARGVFLFKFATLNLMAKLKTIKNDANVEAFIESIVDPIKRQDCYKLLDIFKTATAEEPSMWGSSIIGFGSYHYKSERSKQEGDWPLTGFSPRKQNLTIYIMNGFEKYTNELADLGKHKISKSCLYIKRLSDIDITVLQGIIRDSAQQMKQT